MSFYKKFIFWGSLKTPNLLPIELTVHRGCVCPFPCWQFIHLTKQDPLLFQCQIIRSLDCFRPMGVLLMSSHSLQDEKSLKQVLILHSFNRNDRINHYKDIRVNRLMRGHLKGLKHQMLFILTALLQNDVILKRGSFVFSCIGHAGNYTKRARAIWSFYTGERFGLLIS